MVRLHRFWTLCCVYALATLLSAQTPMDITLVPGQDNNLEVRIRPVDDFDGLIAGMVFTMRWSNASGANLGSIQQDILAMDVCDASKSGPEQVIGEYRYQVFVAFSLIPLFDIPYTLQGGEEFTLFTIPVLNAQDVFAIVEDPWTNANNGNYFVSLGGNDWTGEIYDVSTATSEVAGTTSGMHIWPNPVDRVATLRNEKGWNTNSTVQIFDATGKLALSTTPRLRPGSTELIIDVAPLAPGAYSVVVLGHHEPVSLRFVKR